MLRFATMLLFGLLAGAAQAFGPLEDPKGFDPASADLILDIRSPKDFAKGHVPGAVNTPYGLYRGPRDNPGRVPSTDTLQNMLRAAGAEAGQSVLVVHQGKNATDFGAAARVYWTLKSLGFDQLAILNGGTDGWTAAGGALSTRARAVAPSQIEVAFSDAWMMDTDAVADVVQGTSEAVLLDARPLEFFEGRKKHGAAAAAGTLAGALNIVHSTWFGGDGPIMAAPEDMLTRIRAVAGENADAPLVSFCNTGHWAATNWFAASELAGVEGVKLYPESMVGWTKLGKAVVKGSN